MSTLSMNTNTTPYLRLSSSSGSTGQQDQILHSVTQAGRDPGRRGWRGWRGVPGLEQALSLVKQACCATKELIHECCRSTGPERVDATRSCRKCLKPPPPKSGIQRELLPCEGPLRTAGEWCWFFAVPDEDEVARTEAPRAAAADNNKNTSSPVEVLIHPQR